MSSTVVENAAADDTDKGQKVEDSTGTEEKSGETTDQANADTDADKEGEPSDKQADGDGQESDLPDWARKRLSKANDEAARYRTQLRELQSKFEGAKTPEEVATVTKELADANAALERQVAIERAMRVYEIDESDVSVFEGIPVERVEAIAKWAQERSASAKNTGDLRGGLDPDSEDNVNATPGELAKRYGKKRR